MAIKPRARVMGGGLRMRKPKTPAPSTQYAEDNQHELLTSHGYRADSKMSGNRVMYRHSSGLHTVAVDDAGGWHYSRWEAGRGERGMAGKGVPHLRNLLGQVHKTSQHGEYGDTYPDLAEKHGYAQSKWHRGQVTHIHPDGHSITVTSSGQWMHSSNEAVHVSGGSPNELKRHLEKFHAKG